MRVRRDGQPERVRLVDDGLHLLEAELAGHEVRAGGEDAATRHDLDDVGTALGALAHGAGEPGAVLEAIERDRVTVFEGVPRMYLALLHHPGGGGRALRSLRVAVSSGGRVPARAIDAFERNIPIEPAAWMASVMNPVEPVSATISSRRSPARDSRISAMRTSLAARSLGFIHGHGPSSNARRAASIAAIADFVDASGTVPITCSVAGSSTSIAPSAPSAPQVPSMKSS